MVQLFKRAFLDERRRGGFAGRAGEWETCGGKRAVARGTCEAGKWETCGGRRLAAAGMQWHGACGASRGLVGDERVVCGELTGAGEQWCGGFAGRASGGCAAAGDVQRRASSGAGDLQGKQQEGELARGRQLEPAGGGGTAAGPFP